MKKLNLIFVLVAATLMSGCIPLMYQGKYVDAEGLFSIKLKARSAVIQLKDHDKKRLNFLDTYLYGETDPDYFRTHADAKGVQDLLAGEEAVFLRAVSSSDAEIIYIIPDKQSVRTSAQVTWFNAGVYRILLDLSEPKDKTVLMLFYCENGQTQVVRAGSEAAFLSFGCPANSKFIELKRQLPKGV